MGANMTVRPSVCQPARQGCRLRIGFLDGRSLWLILGLLLGGVIAACGSEGADVSTATPRSTPLAEATSDRDGDDSQEEAWRAPVIPETSGFDDEERLSAIRGGVPVVVRGVLYSDFRGWRLCNVIDESAPPQCGLEIWLDIPREIDPTTVGEQGEMEDSITGSDVPIVLGEHVAAVGILTAPDRLQVASLVVDENMPVGPPGRVAGSSAAASEDRLEALGRELTGIGFDLRREGRRRCSRRFFTPGRSTVPCTCWRPQPMIDWWKRWSRSLRTCHC
jgi:hypothetical protein